MPHRKKDTKTVFVTEYGEAVHNSLSCSGLKRTVYRTLLEEAGNHSPCGKWKREKLPEKINVSDKETYQIKKRQIAGYKQ